jgi:hypothetical protein
MNPSMLLLIVIVGLVALLFYKGRPVVAPPWTPPTQPWPPQQFPPQTPQGFAQHNAAPQASQSAQGSAPIARPSTFAPPPPSAPVAGGFAPPPTAEQLAAQAKPAPLPPPVDLNDVFRRPGA